MSTYYDIIVVGAGHAGCEAALAAGRLNRRVLMVSLQKDQIGRLSCNPAIGGLAKGNLVREIDALGGSMAVVADRSSIQFRRLNTRRGLAVQSSRAQVDIHIYPKEMGKIILSHPNIDFVEGEAAKIFTNDEKITGLGLGDGQKFDCGALILTTGTFLSGVMHCGESQTKGGRVGENAAYELSKSLIDLGLRLGRLKTGTTPRLDARTIDWDRIECQKDTIPQGKFSFSPKTTTLPQIDCHLTHTNEKTHEVIRSGLARSPLFSGQIVGRGPRYCPSIEDKIVRFEARNSHLLFIEPEGLNTNRVYVNGLSTSLPHDLQEKMVQTIVGLENAKILQYGYAVEYDYANPMDLDHGLQHKKIPGLFLAGQINGTSGYEEAAAQGMIAGISAAIQEPFILRRDQAYIGVLIDDLVTKGVGGEPYRMFSSRAEHRLLLREDNADRRLMPIAHQYGLISEQTWQRFQIKMNSVSKLKDWCKSSDIKPNKETKHRFVQNQFQPPKSKTTAEALLRRPKVFWAELEKLFGVPLPKYSNEVIEQVITDIKYAGYLDREQRRAERTQKMSVMKLPSTMNYRIPGISHEVAERLEHAQPITLAAAARLPGITPAAIDTLAIYLSKK